MTEEQKYTRTNPYDGSTSESVNERCNFENEDEKARHDATNLIRLATEQSKESGMAVDPLNLLQRSSDTDAYSKKVRGLIIAQLKTPKPIDTRVEKEDAEAVKAIIERDYDTQVANWNEDLARIGIANYKPFPSKSVCVRKILELWKTLDPKKAMNMIRNKEGASFGWQKPVFRFIPDFLSFEQMKAVMNLHKPWGNTEKGQKNAEFTDRAMNMIDMTTGSGKGWSCEIAEGAQIVEYQTGDDLSCTIEKRLDAFLQALQGTGLEGEDCKSDMCLHAEMGRQGKFVGYDTNSDEWKQWNILAGEPRKDGLVAGSAFGPAGRRVYVGEGLLGVRYGFGRFRARARAKCA